MAKIKPLLIALLIGIINAIVFVFFEWVVNTGTNYIWNDLFKTNEFRLLVIPLAIILSISFSILLKLLKTERVIPVETDLLAEKKIAPTSIKAIGLIFVIGAASLLAGASLGPEASLFGMSLALGVWFSQRSGNFKAAGLYSLASMGALLVAFFGSLIPLLIPIIFLYKKEKKIVFTHMLVPIIAGFAAYIGLIAIKGSAEGFGSIPLTGQYRPIDFLTALLLGIIGTFIAFLLKFLIKKFTTFSGFLEKRFHWIVTASIFGGVLGLLYFIGGQSIQFSGSVGTHMLIASESTVTAAVLVVAIIAKLLATSWSLPTGFRGGLVFPSVYMGAALGIFVETLDSNFTGPGIVLGSISGILTAMTSPVLGLIMIISITPIQLLGIAVAGMAGAIVGQKIISLLLKTKQKTNDS